MSIIKDTSHLAEFKADVGFVQPLITSLDNLLIVPFPCCPESIQKTVAEHLAIQWGENYNIEFIKKHWPLSDTLYVLIKDEKYFIGCVAIDRKNFQPYISQLYIIQQARNKGHAKLLLQHAEKYVKTMGFNTVNLWCNSDLVSFYTKLGWNLKDGEKSNVNIMFKNI